MTREEAIEILQGAIKKPNTKDGYLGQAIDMAIKALEQEPQTFKWCTDCREYDQEKHCCHRWSKVIRNTVEEMKQEPILNKIRAEIEEYQKDAFYSNDVMMPKKMVLAIIDKYKAESEDI